MSGVPPSGAGSIAAFITAQPSNGFKPSFFPNFCTDGLNLNYRSQRDSVGEVSSSY